MMRVLIFLLFSFHSRIPGAEAPFTFQETHMGTLWTLKLYASDQEKAGAAARAAFGRIAEIDAIMSDYKPDSELSRLSATAGSGMAVAVRGDLLSVLSLSAAAAAESTGAFDITIGPCVQLWRSSRKSRQLPEPELLAAARAATGWQAMHIKDSTVTLAKPGMKLDLGGIAKGWAQDAALSLVKEKHGITAAMLDAGGGVLVSGHPPDRAFWGVALAPFSDEQEEGRAVLLLKDAAVATSGDLFQSVSINGQRYSHIIDPATGLGMTRPVQVSIVAPTGALADWLATAVCVMGPEKGIEWLRKTHPQVEARAGMAVDGKVVIKETSGFADLLSKPAH